MNTYEQLLYLLRIPVLIISAVIIALIFNFTQPELAQAESLGSSAPEGVGPVRADLYAGLIASSDALHAQPGVFSEAQFTQQTAEQLLVAPPDQEHLYAIHATLKQQNGSTIAGPILINKPAYTQLEAFIGKQGVEQHTKTLPAVIKRTSGEQQQAIIEVVVTYEP